MQLYMYIIDIKQSVTIVLNFHDWPKLIIEGGVNLWKTVLKLYWKLYEYGGNMHVQNMRLCEAYISMLLLPLVAFW